MDMAFNRRSAARTHHGRRHELILDEAAYTEAAGPAQEEAGEMVGPPRAVSSTALLANVPTASR
jgi:hypothetical protein